MTKEEFNKQFGNVKRTETPEPGGALPPIPPPDPPIITEGEVTTQNLESDSSTAPPPPPEEPGAAVAEPTPINPKPRKEPNKEDCPSCVWHDRAWLAIKGAVVLYLLAMVYFIIRQASTNAKCPLPSK